MDKEPQVRGLYEKLTIDAYEDSLVIYIRRSREKVVGVKIEQLSKETDSHTISLIDERKLIGKLQTDNKHIYLDFKENGHMAMELSTDETKFLNHLFTGLMQEGEYGMFTEGADFVGELRRMENIFSSLELYESTQKVNK